MVGLSRSFEGLVVSDGVLGLAFAFADVVAVVVGVAFAIVALAFTTLMSMGFCPPLKCVATPEDWACILVNAVIVLQYSSMIALIPEKVGCLL